MRLFGLIGKPLSHSFSKNYFTQKFLSEGIRNCSYENFPLDTVDELPALLQSRPELEGLNVTIPYKEKVLALLDEMHEDVAATGACNCIRVVKGRCFGFNTDIAGFRGALQPYLNNSVRKALILGTGGAAKAVAFALQQLSIKYSFVSRTAGHGISYANLDPELISEHLLIINTTPLGMYPNTETAPELPYSCLTSRHILFDLVYNPEKTKFLEQGEHRGAAIINGYNMLVIQAEESWKIWNS